jgi:hypothetical protein
MPHIACPHPLGAHRPELRSRHPPLKPSQNSNTPSTSLNKTAASHSRSPPFANAPDWQNRHCGRAIQVPCRTSIHSSGNRAHGCSSSTWRSSLSRLHPKRTPRNAHRCHRKARLAAIYVQLGDEDGLKINQTVLATMLPWYAITEALASPS